MSALHIEAPLAALARPSTYVPTPSLRTWARALSRRPLSDQALAEPWCRDSDQAFWLSRSAHALRIVAALSTPPGRAGQVCVWIPDYFCGTALDPLRAAGARLVFYPLTPKLHPDYPACRAMAVDGAPDVFVLVHFFGLPAPVTEAAEFSRRHACLLVEDAAHVFLPLPGVGEKGDFVLYSPHKHLPIPNGAVLVVRDTASTKLGLAPAELAERVTAAILAGSSEEGMSGWTIRRLAQRVGLRGRASARASFGDDVPARGGDALQIQPLSRRLLSALKPTLHSCQRIRQRNCVVLDHLLGGCFGGADEAFLSNRYLLMREFPEFSQAAAFHDRARAAGWPACAWPDLPREVVAAPSGHSRAIELRRTRVHFHVHQDLDFKGMIAASCVRPLARGIILKWFDGEQQGAWEDLYRRSGQANLLQTSVYAEQKARLEGHRVRRGVFFHGEKPTAVVIATRRFPGVWRINRGPLWLENPDAESVEGTLVELRRHFRGRLLAFAPNLEGTAANWLALMRAGFTQRGARPWETVWLDLAPAEEALRSRLAPKWRNALSFAERANLVLDSSQDPAAVEWLLNHHQEAMKAKSFAATPRLILEGLRHAGTFMVLRAMKDGVPVGGVGIALHQPAATYLVGWNGPEGRSLKANQFLLWRAILVLRQAGFTEFDLGGIDDVGLPGISEFKLGTGGRRVRIVGEFTNL